MKDFSVHVGEDLVSSRMLEHKTIIGERQKSFFFVYKILRFIIFTKEFFVILYISELYVIVLED